MALNKANEGLPWVDWNDEDQNIKGSNEGLEAENLIIFNFFNIFLLNNLIY